MAFDIALMPSPEAGRANESAAGNVLFHRVLACGVVKQQCSTFIAFSSEMVFGA